MDIKLPDCITSGKAAREVSWFALLEHIRTKVAQDGPRARVDLSRLGPELSTLCPRNPVEI